MFDVIVIGAGVSGLLASGKLAQKGLSVLLLEKMEKPARKLRITGKGRCNITNTSPIETHLEKLKTDPEFMSFALQHFDSKATMEFFESIGVPVKVERGNRVFPMSESAVDLAQKFVKWVENQGVEIKCHAVVESVEKLDEGTFFVKCEDAKYESVNVVIACGGASYPSTGSSGDGYNLAYDLGHNIVSVRPSLVPLVVRDCEDLEGLELRNVEAKLVINSILDESRFGDVDFTNRGLAGAAILQLSRLAVDAIGDKKRVEIVLDLKPALSREKILARISREIEGLQSATFKILLQKLTPSALHKQIAMRVDVPLKKAVTSLRNADFERLTDVLKGFALEVVDYRPFSEAIVTAGGVDTSEVDCLTMRSKLVEGLYFCGEVLDIDADTGGFNIQLALATGALVAKSIIK